MARLQEQEQEQERKYRNPQPTSTCGNLFYLHKCVSTLADSNLESSPPSSSAPPSPTIIAMVSHDEYDLFGRFPNNSIMAEVLGLAFACGLWIVIIYDMFQPSTTRIAHHLRPKSRYFLSFFPSCLLALWTVVMTIRTMMIKVAVAGDRCWNPRLGYTISGALFGSLMAVEAIMTFLFDRRRYNTARKVNAFQEQQDLRRQEQEQQQLQLEQSDEDTAAAGIELGGSDGNFQESGLFEGKISLDTYR
ncbi:hypothetical protein EC957_005562 [Mortierella hygrophila]|uniref:Uncharacterized protein n=1 Tax=Mortierella hygrophila TaxID=979708 RepID=A0A9P6JZM3_9FUNG|nr:hypothetical protein EC957_005562 [Mortierella hygrophila]